MFCRFCGSQLLDDSSMFCSKCGAKLTIDSGSGNQHQIKAISTYHKEDFSIDKIKFIGVNLGFIVIYFIGWLKFTNSDMNFVLRYIGINNSVAPKFLFDVVRGLNKLAERTGQLLPIYCNLFYLLILIPICGGIAILLCIIKQEKYSIYACKVSFVLSAIACLGALALTLDANVGMRFGLLIAIGVTVLAKFCIESYEGELCSITDDHILLKGHSSIMENHILLKADKSNPNSSERWICKKCGTENKKLDLYCKDCGAYK